MKRRCILIFFTVVLVFTITACTQQNNDSNEINETKQQNVTLYSLTGTMQIDVADVDEYLANGWYTEPVVTMYAADGRTRVTLESEVEAYRGVGWYTEPVVTMYAADGRTQVTLESEVEAYKNVGWYTEPVITMYAADGRTRLTLESEVEAYKNVGWYLAYNLDENEKCIINAMLYGIGGESIGEISKLSDTFLVERIIDTSMAEYNSFNATDMISYTDNVYTYTISEQEMQTAMNLMYGRSLKNHIACSSIININDKDYEFYAPNGRGNYVEIKIQSIFGDENSFIVNYSYCYYNTAEHSINRTADRTVDLIAKFSRNQNINYPFKLLSIYNSNGITANYKRIYPDTTVKQVILNQYFVRYSPQDYYGVRYKFNDDGSVEIVGCGLDENNYRFYDREMGVFNIGNNNEINISTYDRVNRNYTHTITFKYCNEQNYFYDHEFTAYKEAYAPNPFEYLPVDPNDKGIVNRFKVFTYSHAPSFETMSTDWNKKTIIVG